MWSDKDIDNAFQRLNPPEPEPAPFPLDAWLRLETGLDKDVIERAVRRRLWKLFAAEVAVVLLVALGWLLWPASTTRVTAGAGHSKSAAAENAAPTASAIQQTSAHQSVIARAAVSGMVASADGTLHQPEVAASEPASGVAPAPAAPHSASTPSSTAANTPVLSVNQMPSAAARFSVAAEATRNGRRRADDSRRAYRVTANSQHTRHITYSPSASTKHEGAATRVRIAHAGAPQASYLTAALAQNTDQHPAAGNLAAPTKAPAEAVVADAAASQLRRESQSPLPTRTSAPAMLANEVSETDAAAGSVAAVATLTPIAIRLPLAASAELPAPLAPAAIAPANLAAAVRQPRFYIGLVAAPDLTTVKFVDVEHPRLNVGVVLEYRLTNRLLVNTGLMRASKAYYARREDYDWSAYPRAATRNFAWVDGACTVLDIPLNLRYDAVVRPQARLFGSVGLSSFFMQRERYRYDYTEYNTTYLWERSYVNENRHLLSVLNLSFGYERSLGAHWRVQAEPYAKLPLGGVGAGKVRLTSGGVFFGVKYGF